MEKDQVGIQAHLQYTMKKGKLAYPAVMIIKIHHILIAPGYNREQWDEAKHI